jgi:hypothetical protein
VDANSLIFFYFLFFTISVDNFVDANNFIEYYGPLISVHFRVDANSHILVQLLASTLKSTLIVDY